MAQKQSAMSHGNTHSKEWQDTYLLLGVHAGKALVARTAVARGGVVVGSLSAASAVASLATLGSNLAHLLLGTGEKKDWLGFGHVGVVPAGSWAELEGRTYRLAKFPGLLLAIFSLVY